MSSEVGGGSDPEDVSVSWDWGRADADDAPPLALDTIVPPSGPLEGGSRVRIIGDGLHEGIEIFVGGRPMETTYSGDALIGRVPPGSNPGPVTVKAVDPSGERTALAEGYTYVGGLEVDRITPRTIPTEGGVQIVLRGSNFDPSTAVSIDGQSARRVRRIDAETLRIIAPSGQPGPADLRITTPDQSRVFEEALTYRAPLTIDSIAPASGPTVGGQEVTLEATGLDPDARVELDGQQARTLSLKPARGTMRVETPAHAGGAVNVTLRSDGEATRLEDAYYYREDQTSKIASVRPDHGPTSGGTKVVLTGYGFQASNASIQFGDETAAIVDATETRAVVETPRVSDSGAVDVSLQHGNREVDAVPEGFEYRTSIRIDEVTPSTGPVEGGTKVTLEGEGLADIDRVLFDGLPASFEPSPSDASMLEVTTPAHTAGSVDVEVVRNGIETRHQNGFTYEAPLEIWGYTPARGAIAGGTYVEVRGRGFAGEIGVELDGESSRKVRRIDRNNLYFYTPPHEPGSAPLTVEARGETARAPYPYEYFEPASRYGGASGGSVRGAINVTVLARGGGPISDAFVMLSTRADTSQSGMTNQRGQITLSGPDVRGPQTITAVAKGYTSTTLREVDAENITLFLRKKDPNQSDGGGGGGSDRDPPPYGVIEGDVTAPGKARDPDGNVGFEAAMVRTTRESRTSRSPIEPGDQSVVLGTGGYRLRSRIGNVAVVALCGDYDESTDTFTPKFMGVKRYLQVAEGESYEVDLACDIPLDQTLDVKIANPIFAPDGPNINRAEVYWNFGFAGVFPSPTTGRDVGSIVEVPRQPALDGPLSDVTMTIVGGSFTGEGSPSSQTTVEDVEDISGPVALHPLVDVPEPIQPMPGEQLRDRELRFQVAGPKEPAFYSIYLLNEEGRRFWHYLMPGHENVVELPRFPDLSHLPEDKRPNPVARGRAFVLILGADAPSVTYNQWSYRDLSLSEWRGYAMTRWGFRISDNSSPNPE